MASQKPDNASRSATLGEMQHYFHNILVPNPISAILQGWGNRMISTDVKLVDGSTWPKIWSTFEYTVDKEQVNGRGQLHGGCTATVLDITTSVTHMMVGIKDPKKLPTSDVTTYLHVGYIQSAFEGDVLLIETELVKLGKKLAVLKGTIKRKSDGAIIATSEMGKFNTAVDSKL